MGKSNYKRKIMLQFDYGEVKQGVQSTSGQMKILRADFNATKSEAKAFGKTSDELGARQKYLTERIKMVNDELKQNKDRLKEATEKQGEGSKAVENYKTKVEVSQHQLRGLEAELSTVNKRLDEQKTFLGKTSNEWENTGEKMESVGKSMSLKLTAPIMAAGTYAFKMSADYEQALGKMEVVFEKNSDKIQDWANNAMENFGLSRKSAVTMVSDYGALFKGMGIAMDDTQEWSMTLTERVMDLSNFYDTTVDETTNALNAIVTGQTEPLRRFGINMTQATLQEYAFESGINKKIQTMTEAEKVQLRYNFVMDRTAIALGTTKKEADTATGQFNKLKQQVDDLAIEFGTLMLPVLVKFLQAINKVLTTINKLDDGTKKIIITIAGIVAAIGPMLILVGKTFQSISRVNEGIKDGKELIGGLGKVGKGFGKLLGDTKFLGFAKWALVIAGVATAIYLVISALNDLMGKSSSANQTLSQINQLTGNTKRATNQGGMRGFAVGTKYVEQDQIAQIHKGEAIIPANSNPYNPNSRNTSGLGGGDIINLNVNIDEVDEVYKLIQTVKRAKQNRRSGGEQFAY